MWKFWVLGWGAVVALGCGGSSHGDAAILPSQECATFVEHYCGHAADCLVEDGIGTASDRDPEYQACLSTAKQSLPCDKAVAVGQSYSACLMDVETSDCSSFAS